VKYAKRLNDRLWGGKSTYIITIRRMISGEELKYRNGLASFLGLDIGSIYPKRLKSQSGAFALTVPLKPDRQLSELFRQKREFG
jgi:hypothetical protein